MEFPLNLSRYFKETEEEVRVTVEINIQERNLVTRFFAGCIASN